MPDTNSNERPAKTYGVVINGTPYDLDDEVVTYETLGALAFPGHDPAAIFTVEAADLTYRAERVARTELARLEWLLSMYPSSARCRRLDDR